MRLQRTSARPGTDRNRRQGVLFAVVVSILMWVAIGHVIWAIAQAF
ncbi:MAG: hypothetical protein AB7V13_10975 [Pseudorhodoplanes sp.]